MVNCSLSQVYNCPDKPATLVWVEALDGGNPREKVPHRDKLVTLSAPFTAQPHEVFQTEERFRNLDVLAGGKALVGDYERVQRIERTLALDLENPSAPTRDVFSRNERDAYRDPGKLVMRTSSEGRRQAMQSGDEIFLAGEGASPAGDKPFLDRFNLTTGKAQRLFQSSSGYEEIVEVLDDAGTRLLTRRESPTDPPNYFIRSGANLTKLTNFPDPMPQAAGIKKQLVTYTRADGIPLSFTLYLPADYKPGTRIPALVWAYPYEFSDSDTAGQVTGHADQAFNQLNYHQLPVLRGYALMDNAS